MENNNNIDSETFCSVIQLMLTDKQNKNTELLNLHINNINSLYEQKKIDLKNEIALSMNSMSKASQEEINRCQSEITSNITQFFDIQNLFENHLRLSLLNMENHINSLHITNNSNSNPNTTQYIKKALFNEDLLIQNNFNLDLLSKYDLSYDNKSLTEGIKDYIMTSKIKNETRSQIESLIDLSQPISTLLISNKDEREKDIAKIKGYANTITKLKFKQIDKAHQYFNHFNYNEDIIYTKMTKLIFDKCNFNSISFENNDIIESNAFPALTYIKYTASFPSEDTHVNALSLPPLSLTAQMPNIQVLKFEKANIVNSELESIFINIILNTNLLKTLRVISFASNSIKSFNFKEIISNDEYNEKFDQLEEIDFSNNKMFMFKLGYTLFPQLMLVNLIDNQLSNKIEVDFPINKRTLLFCNRNLLLTNQSTLNEYSALLMAVMPNYNYKIKYMCLSGLFTKATAASLINFPINADIASNLKMLDLSYCGLSTDIVIKFLTKNNDMSHLRNLNLQYNFITLDFFEEYNKAFDDTNKLNGKKRLVAIEAIDLSNNMISNLNFKPLLEFICNHKGFVSLNVEMNPFGREYSIEKKGDMKDIGKMSILPFYTVNIIDKDIAIGDNMTFCDLLLKLYHPEMQIVNRVFYLDFSTESKMIKASHLDKKKYTLTVKAKQAKYQ